MFGTIRKHQTWLWAIIIVVVVISFVVYFSPTSRMSNPFPTQTLDRGSIYGEPVTDDDFRDAWAEVYLRYLLTRGEWPDKDPAAKQAGFDEPREVYQRLLVTRKLKQLNVQVGAESVAQVAADILRNFGRGRGVSLEQFEKQILANHNPPLSANDFERFLRHDLGIQQLVNLGGLSGTLITPQEALALYRHEHEDVVAEIVTFPVTNFLSAVTATPAEVAQFYTNQMARYRIPERIQINYVKFDLTNFWADADAELAKLTNLNAIVDNYYEQRGTNYYHEAKTPEEAKQLIRDEIRKNTALVAARKKAVELAGPLFDQEPVLAANLEKWAAEKNLPPQTSQPFDRENGPSDLKVSPAFTKAAFSLTGKEPIAGPLPGDDGMYIIALNKRLPSEIPPLDSILDQVTTDYKFAQAVGLAHQKGLLFHTTLTNGLAEGKRFSALCLDAQLQPVALPPFSRSTRALPEAEHMVQLALLQDVASRVPAGQASAFIPTGYGGFIVYVQSRLPADDKKLEAELPGFLAVLRQTGQSEVFNNWFMREANTGLRDTPLGRQPSLVDGAPKE